MTDKESNEVWICCKTHSPWDWDGASEETVEHIYNNKEKANTWLKTHHSNNDDLYHIFMRNVE